MWALRLRCFALLGAGALALHELRYLVAYGGDAGRALDEQGHGYLGTVAALVAVAVVASVATLVAALVRGRRPAARAPSWRLRWLGASAALLIIYAAPELAEGMLASGHPEGLAGGPAPRGGGRGGRRRPRRLGRGGAGRGPGSRCRRVAARRRGRAAALRRRAPRPATPPPAQRPPARAGDGAAPPRGRPRPPRRGTGATPPRSLTGLPRVGEPTRDRRRNP